MINLLKKEFKLALHPTTFPFMALAAMVLIPNYPYDVAFFYTCLGIFFIFLTGRENYDIQYMLLLPVAKRDIVKARFIMVIILELCQLIVAIPFIWLSNFVIKNVNLAGLDANIALLGSALIMYAFFNYIFLTNVYKNTDNVGASFLLGGIYIFVHVFVEEVCVFAIPFVRDVIDTPDPQNIGVKLAILAGGAVVYALMTWLAYRRAASTFEKLDF